jgi:hypothetical protein
MRSEELQAYERRCTKPRILSWVGEDKRKLVLIEERNSEGRD